MKKQSIQVRRYLANQTPYGSARMGEITGDCGTFEIVETISRVLRAESIGNFCPLFCTYKGNARCLVQSDAGDVSDPFRRDESYAKSCFIVEKPQVEKPLLTFDGNLDDEEEARAFIETHGTGRGRALANRLGFTGKGSGTAASALSNYAWNKATACDCRSRGDTRAALIYESICDRIYSEDIAGKINCW